MNRTALGLAIGAGYMLGRTKKLKMALAVGSVVAGKKLNLTPRALGELLQQQLRDNPQFKEIGDQLRQDMRGVGKAATGAMAERQMNALADRLRSRTSDVRDRLSGGGSDEEEPQEDTGDEEPRDDTEDSGDADTSGGRRDDEGGSGDGQDDEDGSEARREERPRKKAAQKAPAKKASGTSTAKKAASKTPAKKTGAARKTAAKKTASAGGGSRGGGSRQAKGGDDR
ncbi:DNA primase [Streptomyces sp. IBSBF 3136]|uniref:DNA primase n=1 Tax=Streptomyces sp. IBSBF 3136 TaxID=2903524 RepID=UPI002FDC4C76